MTNRKISQYSKKNLQLFLHSILHLSCIGIHAFQIAPLLPSWSDVHEIMAIMNFGRRAHLRLQRTAGRARHGGSVNITYCDGHVETRPTHVAGTRVDYTATNNPYLWIKNTEFWATSDNQR